MKYRISGLRAEQFTHLFGRSNGYLGRYGAVRQIVTSYPGYPDRISLCDIPVGETALLINHIYQPADTPYRGSHAIYIWEGCTEQGIYINELPEVMNGRVPSLRAYNEKHSLIKAEICEGQSVENFIDIFFAYPQISYIQIHNAKQGCFACLAERFK